MAEITLDFAIAQLDYLLNGGLDTLVEENTTAAAEDGLAMLDRRVVRQGKDAKGQAFLEYTPKYKKFKEKAGKYRSLVDLQFSGDMWKGIGITSSGKDNGRYRVVVYGKTVSAQDKIEWNVKKRPFMELSKEEQALLVADAQERFFDQINNLFP